MGVDALHGRCRREHAIAALVDDIELEPGAVIGGRRAMLAMKAPDGWALASVASIVRFSGLPGRQTALVRKRLVTCSSRRSVCSEGDNGS